MRDVEREDADKAAEEYPEVAARTTPFPEQKIVVISTPGGDDAATSRLAHFRNEGFRWRTWR